MSSADNIHSSISKDMMGQHMENGLSLHDDGSQLAANISPEHYNYLVEKHGTADLDPVPCFDDEDPFNWPKHRVSVIECLFLT